MQEQRRFDTVSEKMKETANLGRVGRLSGKVKDSAGMDDIDFVRAPVHKVEFLF